MKEIHFNTEHPENHNISIPNKNKNIIKTYDGEFWESGNKKEAMESIVESLFDKFDFMIQSCPFFILPFPHDL